MENNSKTPQHWFLKLENVPFEHLIDIEIWRTNQPNIKDSRLPISSDIGIVLVSKSQDNSYVTTEYELSENKFYEDFSEISLEFFYNNIFREKGEDDKEQLEKNTSKKSCRTMLIDLVLQYSSDEFESKTDYIDLSKKSKKELIKTIYSILKYYKNN